MNAHIPQLWTHPIASRALAVVVVIITFLAMALAASAATIPLENRIIATVTRTIAGPVEDPLVQPTDLAIDDRGSLFVADGVNDRIVHFSPAGQMDSVITGPADSHLSRPIGIALDSSGALWIADTGNHRLVVRSPDGQQYQTIDLPAGEKPAGPTSVCIRSDRAHTYIADCDNHRILVRENTTGQIIPLGKWGVSLGQFRWPFMLCMGTENHVLITETIGARVQQISQDNRWGGQIGQFGVAMGKLYRPKGIALDNTGRIFVGDSSLGVIQGFDAAGNLLGVLTDPDGHPLSFAHPMGMRFDSQGLLYVVELSANRVAVVTLTPPSPAK
jgi:tripartite motif-containing protein 71